MGNAVAGTQVAYQAAVVLREAGLPLRQCGQVTVSGGMARLDVNMGKAGMFRAVFRPESNALYVVADNLRACAMVPVNGDETNIRQLVERVAD